MSEELFCEQHGPYPAYLGSCPYCGGGEGLPPAPVPLDDDDPGKTRQFYGSPDQDETILPDQARPSLLDDDEATILPARAGQGAAFDEDETQLPLRRQRRILDDPYGDDDIDVTVLDREGSSLMGWMIVKRSPFLRRGQVFKIRSGQIYGRSPRKADIVVDDEKVSSIHARIQAREDHFILLDMGSANGTWVNGEEITGATRIEQDDEIKMGDTIFVLKIL